MSIERDVYREVIFWRQLLERVAADLEALAGHETAPERAKRLVARAMRIRRRLHEGVPDGFTTDPNRPARVTVSGSPIGARS
jgi:hypothetical protein